MLCIDEHGIQLYVFLGYGDHGVPCMSHTPIEAQLLLVEGLVNWVPLGYGGPDPTPSRAGRRDIAILVGEVGGRCEATCEQALTARPNQ